MDNLWNLPSFNCASLSSSEMRPKWLQWKRGFELAAKARGETNKLKLKNMLLAAGGFDLQDVYYNILGTDTEDEEGQAPDARNEEMEEGELDAFQERNPYKEAIEKLDAYFLPKQHEIFERHIFWTLKREPEEDLEKFILRAQNQAARCNFGRNESEARAIAVVDKITLLAPSELREKFLSREQLHLDELTKMVKSYNTIKKQSKEMGSSAANSSGSRDLDKVDGVNRIQGVRGRKQECSRCGNNYGHASADKCPALGKKCNKCGRKDHFAVKCYTRGESQKRKRDYADTKEETVAKKSKIRAIEEEKTEKSSFIFNVGDLDENLWCKVGGVLIEMIIDSGSMHNIIAMKTWVHMKQNGVQVEEMSTECDKVLKAYGQTTPLEIVGTFTAQISVHGDKAETMKLATFYVVKQGNQCLLGKKTAKLLGVLALGLPLERDGILRQVTEDGNRCTEFPKIKGIKLRIEIDETVTPVIQHARRPPIALIHKVEERIDELLRLGIIEKVNEPCDWISPVVIVGKDNDDIRFCVDMRQANKAIKRQNHYMPTFEDFLPQLTSAKIFSRLDVKNAFHQVELHESCRYITTFITHKGVMRYKRLWYGCVIASEIYQMIMEQILSGCQNALNYIDDIIVFGRTMQEHDMALQKVLEALKAYDVVLNSMKCVFRATEIIFLGHKLSANGIEPTEEKMIAIKSCRAPQSKEEVRSFLGLVNYVGRFIPDCATVTFHLRQLTRDKVPFSWTKEHETSFQYLKDLMSSLETLGYFNNDHRTRVIADASPVGLGAVLVQFEGKSDENPNIISYASKSLTDTEMRYCQTEKEALALVWSVERFSVYLIGRVFELETDHKPLEAIFKPTSKPCARIERWVLRLQAFEYTVVYRKGKSNIADPLSRLSMWKSRDDFDGEDGSMVRVILETAAIDITEIEKAAEEDEETLAVKEALNTGDWNDEKIKQYQIFRNELGCVGDILVRGTKLVVPVALRSRMMALAHEGHPGESVMKRRLRDRVWWPGMDKEITKCVKICEGCRLVAVPDKPEPMQRRPLPTKPWIDLAIDFLGPLPSGHYLLVVIDYYSRYKEIEIMKKITAPETRDRLQSIFKRLGYPTTITLDNGRQFIGEEFLDFCKMKGIHLNYTTPYWPQENGEVERQNRSILKRLRISQSLHRDWKQDLEDYLLMYYTTPHTVTGKTPTEMCIGRTIRGKIPSIIDLETIPVNEEIAERDAILKAKGKEKEDEKRGAKESDIVEGDEVLMKNMVKENKLTTTFGSKRYEVTKKTGSRVEVQDAESGKTYVRNASHLKKLHPAKEDDDTPADQVDDSDEGPRRSSRLAAKALKD